jgi:hypothetical protein
MTAEHGTPQGCNEGCRGANCAHHGTNLMTCTEASIRYAGDYQYRKQVDAGTATAAKEVFAKPVKVKAVRTPAVSAPKPVKPPKPVKVAKPKPVKPPKPARASRTPKPANAAAPRKYKANREPRVLAEKPHGTTQAQRRACTGDCPNEEPCSVKNMRIRNEHKALRKIKPFPEGKHGTLAGYSDGCHKASPCPGGADGLTCTQAAVKYQLSAAHRRRDNNTASAPAGAVSNSPADQKAD